MSEVVLGLVSVLVRTLVMISWESGNRFDRWGASTSEGRERVGEGAAELEDDLLAAAAGVGGWDACVLGIITRASSSVSMPAATNSERSRDKVCCEEMTQILSAVSRCCKACMSARNHRWRCR